MKNYLLLIFALVLSFSFSQKKKNGTMYIEHPAIDVVEKFYKAVSSNNLEALDELIGENFKGVNGNNTNKDAEGMTKNQFMQRVSNYHTNMRYFSLKHGDNGYPDAVEYKDETFKSVTWVYTWELLEGVGGTTGVKFSQPVHGEYVVNQDNKIVWRRVYENQFPYVESWQSLRELEDGDIYSHHPNINTVRKAIHAIEFGDNDNFFVDFAENATFGGMFQDWGDDDLNADDFKAGFLEFKKSFTINSCDNAWIKYYEFDRQLSEGVVQSWWRMSVTRKSDNKEIVFPVMFNHTFNEEGKITNHQELWNQAKLN